MGIRADMEARYWKELGREKAREIAEHCFECLKDPNAWMRMQREMELTDAETCLYLHCIDWLKENMLTRAKVDG